MVLTQSLFQNLARYTPKNNVSVQLKNQLLSAAERVEPCSRITHYYVYDGIICCLSIKVAITLSRTSQITLCFMMGIWFFIVVYLNDQNKHKDKEVI